MLKRGPEINKPKSATAPPATSPSCGLQPRPRPGGPSRSSSIDPPKPSFAAPDSSAPTRQGIKRTSPKCRRESTPEGTSGIVPLEIALEVAEQVGMPLMAHIDHPPPSYEDVLARLRPGDVLTHAFRPFPNTAATAQGTVKRVVLEARERGVLFDIGHGNGSFAFKTARAMLANG